MVSLPSPIRIRMMSDPDPGRQNHRDASEDESRALVEYLAKHYHAAGSATPAISWNQLSEPERRVFLSRARQTLVAVHGAGYEISRITATSDAPGPSLASDADALRLRIAEAEHFLHAGEPLLAYNEVQQGLEYWPESLRLRQLQGLSLARSGAMRRANQVLQSLKDEGLSDGETMGLLARTHKDLGLSAIGRAERLEHLSAAFRIYHDAYRSSLDRGRVADAYYTGINAATMALLLDKGKDARAIAANVRELCLQELGGDVSGDAEFWLKATLGEAALVLGELDEARSAYRDAAQVSEGRFGDLASTRRQANLLLDHMGLEAGWILEALAAPPVLVFTGHMIDAPGRAQPRFPHDLEAVVQAAIRSRIDSVKPLAAYGSAACGTDILCLEAMLERGAETHIILPFPPEEFRRVSVDFAPGGDWARRFERVIESADSVTVTSEHRATGSASSYEYANLVLTGMGSLRAGVLGTDVVGLAVWDGLPGDGGGGTAAAVELWEARKFRVERIAVQELRDSLPAETGEPGSRPQTDHPFAGFRHEIKAMLFADAVGYSRLTEDQIPIFISRFLGSVARLNDEVDYSPMHCETAGDGLYMVFASVADAGRYAIALSEMVHTMDWEEAGMPGDMDIRVALHCGPVFCGKDPVTGRPLYTGPHTSRTARIEPITPPGQVYASSAFAAVAAAVGVTDVDFRYVGRTQLAKKYGSLPLFHVRRASGFLPA